VSSGSPCHRRRPVDSNDLMTKARQVTADPTFAAANIERQATGGRYEREKRIPVKAPVTVMARCPRPGDPILCVGLPGISHHHHIVSSGVSHRPGSVLGQPWARSVSAVAKGTALSVHSQAHLDAVARELNGRPRRTLGGVSPSQAFAEAVAGWPDGRHTAPMCRRVAPRAGSEDRSDDCRLNLNAKRP
jgi:hypothetical protein